MAKTCNDMVKTCDLLLRTARWILAHPAVPLIFASPYKTRSFNSPTPLWGVMYQEDSQYDWWKRGNETYQLPNNHFIISCSHYGGESSWPNGKVKLWAVSFDVAGDDMFADFVAEPFWNAVAVRDKLAVVSAYSKVVRYFVQPHSFCKTLQLKAALVDLFTTLYEQIHPGPFCQSDPPDYMLEVLDFIRTNYTRSDLTQIELAARAHRSSDHFGREFLKWVGQSPMQYVKQMRIEQSCRLLKHTNLQIKEIAQETGFTDPLYFSKLFKKETKVTPLAYRRQK